MKIIVPRPFDASKITTNVPLTESAWTAGTYGLGDRRYDPATFNLYEVVVASTTDSPTVGYAKDPKTWDRVGKINRFACFDGIVGHPTVGTDIDMTIDADGSVANGIALFGVTGESIQITMTDPVDGIVYDETFDLVDNSGVGSWYDWYFSPIIDAPDRVVTDLALYGTAEIRIRITGDGTIGEFVLGQITDLGETTYGTQVGILDFSRKDRDTFGNSILIQRAFAKRITYAAQVQTSRVAYVNKVLASRRALPTVYIGSATHPETITYGFFRDFTITLQGPVISECNVEVEGLT